VNTYGESKLAAERVLVDAPGGPAGPPAWCIVRPCCVYGPRDRDVLTLFRAVSRGIAPYSAPRDARLSVIHVDDLVDLVIRALETAQPGSSYMASDGLAHSWPELIAAMGRALGRRPLCLRIPPWVLWPVASLLLLGRPFLDRPHVVCPDKLREARQHSWVASSTKAREELGWAPRRGLDEGVQSTAEWYRRHGWI
jgi:nucleoside-diphosphate-sugar epimerase